MCETTYEVEISTVSGIWDLAETGDPEVDAIAQINRARLYEAYARLEASVDVLETFWTSVDYGAIPEHIEAVLDYDGPPSDELIERYRREWVQSHLRDHAVGDVVDGDRLVDFGQVAEHVFPDEIRHRIEAYLRSDESTAAVDRVRVTTADGQVLTGDVTADGVGWAA